MFFSKPKSYLGVDVGAGGVKLVELKQEKNRPVLNTYGLSSVWQDIHQIASGREKTAEELTTGKEKTEAPAAADRFSEAQIAKYAAMIKAVCKSARTVSKTAVVSLPVSSVFHAVVNLPQVEKNEIDHILKAEVRKLSPRPLEEMALDYQALPAAPGAKSMRFLINAVPREIVVFYSKVFQRAGLVLDSLEPESTALSRSLVGRDSSVNLIIDIGAERTNFFIVEYGMPMTHHSIETGGRKINKILQSVWGVEEGLAEKMKQDLFNRLLASPEKNGPEKQKILALLMPVIDPIVKEIEYSFDIYFHQSGNEEKRPEKIILTGGAAFLPYFTEHLAEKFKLKCYLGDPWGRVVYQEGLKPVLRNLGPRLAVAIGLALRKIV